MSPQQVVSDHLVTMRVAEIGGALGLTDHESSYVVCGLLADLRTDRQVGKVVMPSATLSPDATNLVRQRRIRID